MFKKKNKSVSALIATILLIVVAVALIAIILTWGKSFTTKSISEVSTFKDASDTYLIKPVKLVNGSLIFKNISTVNDDINIIGYKIIASDPDTNGDIQYLDTPIILSQGSQDGIRITTPTDKTFTVQLYTSDGKYIDIKNVTNSGATSVASFAKVFGGTGEDMGYSVQQTSDGGYIATGQISNGNNDDVYLVKLNASGNLDWNKSFDLIEGYSEYGYSVQQTNDNGYIVTGYGIYNIFLLKTTSLGIEDWHYLYDVSGDGYESYGYSVQQTNDNGYIVTGYTSNGSNSDVFLLKTDSSGSQEWNYLFDVASEYFDQGCSVQQTDDNGYIITGYTSDPDTGYSNIFLLKTDSSGSQEWTQIFDIGNYDYAYSVQQTTDEGYIVGGYDVNDDTGYNDGYLLKTDDTGTEEWSKNINVDGESDYYISALDQTSDGGYILAGERASDYGYIYLLKVDSTGNVDWNKSIGTPTNEDYATSVQQTTDGGYVLTGFTSAYSANECDSSQMFIIKTNSSGVVNLSGLPIYPNGC